MTLRIDYESSGFPTAGPVANGIAQLSTSWSDLLWAALTVGRPNLQQVFAHGAGSLYEAVFRLSMVRMALEQSITKTSPLRRTQAAQTLDPSEKGAVNYFLGILVAKLFADRVLGAPWLLHLDVFRDQLNTVLTGRSRPDLVGETLSGDIVALECKGRASPPDARTKGNAKQQARRVVSVNGTPPSFAIGAVTYFAGDLLRFVWLDPEPNSNAADPIVVEYPPTAWKQHYAPALGLIQSRPDATDSMLRQERLFRIEEADLQIGIHPSVLRALLDSNRKDPRPAANEFDGSTRYRADGIALVAGESWSRPFAQWFST